MIWHCCLDVRNAIKTMNKRQLGCMFKGLNADQAKDVLLDELAKGHQVIPVGPACEGFDYAGGGCQGHAGEEER